MLVGLMSPKSFGPILSCTRAPLQIWPAYSEVPYLFRGADSAPGFLLLEVLYRSEAQEDFGMTLKKILHKTEILRLERERPCWNPELLPLNLTAKSQTVPI